MIISRTPFRISLFGGGTDYPSWFREHGGCVVGTAIDKYCYISVRRLPPFFDTSRGLSIHRSNWSTKSRTSSIRQCAEFSDQGVTEGLEIHHDADLPARSGLGSSSSFTVGLLHALHALDSKMISKRDLAREAIRIEQDVLKENVGSQDQLWAAYGGFNRIDFHSDGTFRRGADHMPPERREELGRSIMLFFTGFSRFASDFAQDQIKNMGNRKSQLRMPSAVWSTEPSTFCSTEVPRCANSASCCTSSWRIKRELADSVSNNQIDEIYEAGRDAGAIGGKLLGGRWWLHGVPGGTGKTRAGPRAPEDLIASMSASTMRAARSCFTIQAVYDVPASS